jgi:hypothetical protein
MRAQIVAIAGAVGLLIGLAAGCANQGARAVLPGQTEAQVLAQRGPPAARYAMPEGASRLEYSSPPTSRATWMVDLDASGKVTAYTQVLVDANFAQVRNAMHQDDLLRLLGRPSNVAPERLSRQTLSWRYENNDCLWFSVTLSPGGQVMGKGMFLNDVACKEVP